MPKRIISTSVLPGEPLDGSGRVCIHLFVPEPTGPFVEPHALHPAPKGSEDKLVAKPTRGRLACDPRRTVAPQVRGNVVVVTHRSDDPRAVTCPKCIATDYYTAAMKRLTEEK